MTKFQHNKSLGQHFLKSRETALRIVEALKPLQPYDSILEIGPGLGILTEHLVQLKSDLFISEIDERIITHITNSLQILSGHMIAGDFLRMSMSERIPGQCAVIGNFPYNISSQILFKILENRSSVKGLVGMFQKEMAQRVTAASGNKEYGVITVLVQAYYHTEYLFELPPEDFDPPPKVYSAVIRLKRKEHPQIKDEKALRLVVKTAFNQRRKKLSNALASLQNMKEILTRLNFDGKRAEELSLEDFILLTELWCGEKPDGKKI